MNREYKQFSIASTGEQDIISPSDYVVSPKRSYSFKVVIANTNASATSTVSLYNVNSDRAIEFYYIRDVVIPKGTSLVIEDRILGGNPLVVKSVSGAIDLNLQIIDD
jgi:hypothetical protein